MSIEKARQAREKPFRFPEGVMTMRAWTLEHADCVEARAGIDNYNRRHFNRLEGGAQEEYEKRLAKQREQVRYHAWKGDSFYEISRTVYDAAIAAGVRVKA